MCSDRSFLVGLLLFTVLSLWSFDVVETNTRELWATDAHIRALVQRAHEPPGTGEFGLSKLSNLVLHYESLRGNDGVPFVDHVAMFVGPGAEGKVSEDSIRSAWTMLQPSAFVSWALPGIKARITRQGLEDSHQKNIARGCPMANPAVLEQLTAHPRAKEWRPDVAMFLLKHPVDTGVVRANGSIDADELLRVLDSYAFMQTQPDDLRQQQWVIALHSFLHDIIPQAAKRDVDVTNGNQPKFSVLLGSYETLSRNEWSDAFAVFGDAWVLVPMPHDNCHYVPAMTVDTLLQFYYQPLRLRERRLANELPVPKPACPHLGK